MDTVVLEDVEVVGWIHRGLNSPSTCTESWGYSWNFVALCSSAETNNLVNEQTHKMLESIESLQNTTNEDFSFFLMECKAEWFGRSLELEMNSFSEYNFRGDSVPLLTLRKWSFQAQTSPQNESD